MFREVSSKVSFPKLEEEILKFWQENEVFKKSLEQRKGGPNYVFYEGPPTANGLPGTHHVLARIFKDLFPRYKTMKGCYALRKGGWDTHGLPVELEIEKELGISTKREIEEYGIAEFNQKCKESVFRYVKEWEELTDRIGFWIDMENAYVTLTNDYIESVWWILKQIWEKDLLYQGYKVVPYCPRCGTPLSDHEVALGYKEADDPSIFVRFPLREQEGVYLLVWTTTPWTLPGDVALAVHPNVNYVYLEQEKEDGAKETLILAEELVGKVIKGEYKILRHVKGRELVGLRFKPLYTFLPADKDYAYVVAGDFVTTEEGTGIVHMAPAFGAEDLEMSKEYDLPILHTVDLKGAFIDEVTPWRGMFVKDADPLIIEDLTRRGLMYKVETYRHTYPFCWRCDTPLLYYAKTSWFIETTRMRQNLIDNNEKVNWYPEHIKYGRFGNWLETNIDWALGRERYWGTPLPIWQCENCGKRECIGGVEELRQKGAQPKSLLEPENLDLHRPYIDEITYPCPDCGGTMRRVPEVIDCWFDSGSMPVAQWHYPFENQETFKEQFPADFICEAVDQTRGWFYSLHAISTLLFNEPCFLNCVCLGLILDSEGYKMSKSRGNVVDPWDVINAHGADALRWYLFTASPPGSDRRFSSDLVGEVVRNFMRPLWNTYSFFVTYANIDGFDPTKHRLPVSERSILDRWILAELNRLTQKVDYGLEHYDVNGAARPIADFIENLSNWYVRRSRRRFWKSEKDADKVAAYLTLYECLTTLAKLLAPFIPFIAEEIYQNLVRSLEKDAPESVHLCDFPIAEEGLIDGKLMAEMHLALRIVSLGHSARNRVGIKLRQPLAEVLVKTRNEEERRSLLALREPIVEELNVKEMGFIEDIGQVTACTLHPRPDLLGKEYGPLFPKIRAALAAGDSLALAWRLQSGESITLEVEGQEVALSSEEVEVRFEGKDGYSVAAEAGYLVAIQTEISEELLQEGLAREIVRRIQTMRKEADFRIEEYINTYYQTEGPTLKKVLENFRDYIKRETLSRELVAEKPPEGAYQETFKLEGESITLGVKRR